METKKQEAVRLAWGLLFEKHKEDINEDGYLRFGFRFLELSQNELFEEKQWLGYFFYRPKSLTGLENNRGWTSILSEDDLPKENVECFIVISDRVYLGCFSKRGCFLSEGEEIENRFVSHYQPIQKPNPPIF